MLNKIAFSGFNCDGEENFLSFYPKWSKCRFTFEPWWYFDERPIIITNVTTLVMFISIIISPFTTWWLLLTLGFVFIGWGEIFLKLPYKSGKPYECEGPLYGFYFECVDSPQWKLFEYLRISWGKDKYKYIYMPWDFQWYRTSLLLNNGIWEHETIGKKKKNFWEDEWKEKRWEIKTVVFDKHNECNVECDVHIEKREWRRRWLMWTPLFNKVRKSIEVEFKEEVGLRKGSWKGGTIGCGYEMKKGEDPRNTLIRMMENVRF